MNILVRSFPVLLLSVVSALNAFAAGKPAPHYLFTDDDIAGKRTNTTTIYTIQSNGNLKEKTDIVGGSDGIAGGYFGLNKAVVLKTATEKCLFFTSSASGQIAGMVIPSLKIAGIFNGADGDTGAAFGIGLTINASYVYASFTDANNIGTFQLQSGCKLQFVSDVNTIGLQGGAVDGMAVHGNMMVVTYGDGSIQSFDISAGVPVSNGDEQNSTGFRGQNYPGGVDITSDGHYAIFGDVATAAIVEVSDISSGKLTKTTLYHLGNALSSASVFLTPDETMLYVANTQSGQMTAAFFDKTTGKISKGCTSAALRGFADGWAYLGSVVTQTNTGTGGAVYVTEYGAPSTIGIVNLTVNGQKCTLKESSASPVADDDSQGLLSIATYPPRSF